jgi:uncharacterized protein (TIGR03067 family)
MKLALCFAIFAGLSLASDQDTLQGNWKLALGIRDGKPLVGEGLNATLSIEGDRFTVTQGTETVTGTFKLNEGASPKTADLVTEAGTLQAIYEIRAGNRFRVAVGKTGAARPARFESRAGSGAAFGEWLKQQ